MKIVIWGHPLGTHTHSQSNHGYYRAFKALGHDVHWFPDEEPPEDFDFSNTIFIGEGDSGAKHIPINDTSTYFMMYLPDPRRFDGVKNLIDVRLTAKNCKDHINIYTYEASTSTSMRPRV